jgi:hypothetical protein
VVLAPDADADIAAMAALLSQKLDGRATVQLVTDIRDLPRSGEAMRADPPDFPLALAELVRPMECPDVVLQAEDLPRAGYGPPRLGRKGKPLRW